MHLKDVLSSDPEIVSGAVVFKGTRVPVSALFENLAGGLSLGQFLDSFPTVHRKQAEAALLAAERAVTQNLAPAGTIENLDAQAIVAVVGEAIRTANQNYFRWSGGDVIWNAGVEGIYEYSAAEAFECLAHRFAAVTFSIQYPTSRLHGLGLRMPTDFRHGRIDFVVHDGERNAIYPVEFKRYLNPGNTRDDFLRLTQIISSAKAAGLEAVGFLATSMFRKRIDPLSRELDYDFFLGEARRDSIGYTFTHHVVGDLLFDGLDGTESGYSRHASIVVEVSDPS